MCHLMVVGRKDLQFYSLQFVHNQKHPIKCFVSIIYWLNIFIVVIADKMQYVKLMHE